MKILCYDTHYLKLSTIVEGYNSVILVLNGGELPRILSHMSWALTVHEIVQVLPIDLYLIKYEELNFLLPKP